MDPSRASQMFLSNLMTLMLRLTKPEKNVQSAEADMTIAPKRTLYVNNLNDKIRTQSKKHSALKQNLPSRIE